MANKIGGEFLTLLKWRELPFRVNITQDMNAEREVQYQSKDHGAMPEMFSYSDYLNLQQVLDAFLPSIGVSNSNHNEGPVLGAGEMKKKKRGRGRTYSEVETMNQRVT